MGIPKQAELDRDFAADTLAASPPAAGTIATYRRFEDAEAAWREFERGAVATPYQRIDWMEAWHRHIGSRHGVEPLIVVARDGSGRPSFLWPLGVRRRGIAIIGEWLGCKHVNYKLGLYAPDFAADATRRALVPVMTHLRDETGLDALLLVNQPETWQGTVNPLAALPHQNAPSFAYSLALKPDFDALYAELRSGSTRKKLRRSERRIVDEFGSCILRRPANADEVDRALDIFFLQKSKRMQDRQLSNVFAEPGVMDFFRELAVRSIGAEEPLLDLFWLDAGGHVAATWAGTAAGGRLCGMVNSFDEERFGQHHPGEVMLRLLIEHCCRRGLKEFDLGVGEAQYKESWCPRVDRLFDSFLPLTALGWMHTTAAGAGFRLKRTVKQSRFLTGMADRLR